MKFILSVSAVIDQINRPIDPSQQAECYQMSQLTSLFIWSFSLTIYLKKWPAQINFK